MKNKLFTTLVVFGLSFITWNCSGDPASPIPNTNPAYNPPDLSSSETIPVIVSSSSIATTPTSSVTAPVTVSSSSVTTPVIASSSSVAAPISSATVATSSQTSQPKSSSSSKAADSGKIGSITYTGSLTQTISRGGSITTIKFSGLKSKPSRQSWNIWSISDSDCKYDESAKTFTISGTVHKDIGVGEVTEKWSMDGTTVTLTINVTDGSTTKSSSSKKVASSSSQQTQQSKSSSSKTVSSSTSNSGTSVELKYISGGKSGKGFASRYWDCCKPHCSWPEHAHGNYAKQCTNKGTKESTDWGGGSVCSGGGLMTCTSQIPTVVNDSLAYAFAAVPAADGGSCGKCYALKFTGEGSDGKGGKKNTKNHQMLKGKILVVMATNIGQDVKQGQFDVLIPGGGVGLFNGCASMGWGNTGKQYGGLLAECEGDSQGYSAQKECLEKKCEKAFANDAKAKEGCMFLATWMEAAGNPIHEYKEVECPAGLKAMY